AADQAAQTAAAERGVAEGQRAEAQQTAEVEATQRAIAEGEAMREARVARIRALVAQAKEASQDLAILLAIEAMRINIDAGEPIRLEIEQVLRDALSKIGGRPLDAQAFAVAISPDGRFLVTESAEQITVWDLTVADPRITAWRLPNDAGSLAAPSFSPDSRTLVTIRAGITVLLWDLSTPEPQTAARELRGHWGRIAALAFSPDGSTLASAGEVVRLWNLNNRNPGANALVFNGHESIMPFEPAQNSIYMGDGVRDVAFTPDGLTLISGGADGTIRLWDLRRANPEVNSLVLSSNLRGRVIDQRYIAGGVEALLVSPDGRTLIAGGEDGVKLWDLRATNPSASAQQLPQAASPLVISQDGRMLITGHVAQSDQTWESPSALRWDLTNPTSITEYTAQKLYHRAPVWTLTLSADGKTLVSIDGEGYVYVWDVTSLDGQLSSRTLPVPVAAIPQYPMKSRAVALSPDGHRLAIGGRIWQLDEPDQAGITYTLREQNNFYPYTLRFSSDGAHLLAGESETVHLWDLRIPDPGTNVRLLPSEGYGAEFFSLGQQQQLLAISGPEYTIQIWDLAHTEPILRDTLTG
ncbi:MAG: hypothetical protein EOM24_21150, partial [Chloroflexia bacterium]|nr:hypothetical protein [Chloroflexia bacterium]